MKIYNLNIDTSKPTNQVVQMQQNVTGLLSANVTNSGIYIRNLSCTIYDGANEISATTSADNSFGFKVDVGTEPKHVKVVAKSTPLTSTEKYLINAGTGRIKQTFCDAIQIPAGTYRQDEFLPLVEQFGYKGPIVPGVTVLLPAIFFTKSAADVGKANFDRISIISWNPTQQLYFSMNGEFLSPDEPLVVTEDVVFGHNVPHNQTGVEFGTREYPAIGYYTDYQLDTLVKPSDNAPYDGNYVEPINEIEVDGVKFVPTTLSVDGVEYKVLAEAQPAPEPEEPATNDGE